MDHVQPVVTPVLLHREVPRVAISAMDLERQTVGFQAPFAGPAFGDRRQYFQQNAGLVGLRRLAGVLFVNQTGAIHLQRQRAFAVGFLGQQHAFDVGMLDERHLRLRGVFATSFDGTPLRAGFGVVQRGLVTCQAQHGGGGADADTRLVHHMEHTTQALARFTHQITHRARATTKWPIAAHGELAFAEVKQSVGRAAPPELVVEPGQRHVISLAGELTLRVDQFLRHDKKRNTACAGYEFAVSIRNFGQHQVDDVLGQLMLTGRNPHFVAFEAVPWA